MKSITYLAITKLGSNELKTSFLYLVNLLVIEVEGTSVSISEIFINFPADLWKFFTLID